MIKKSRPKRTYNSTRRKAQSLDTQAQIVKAAEELFIERGYMGTSIDAIAQKANVAPETVYSNFGNKKAILSRVVDIAVVGDGEPIPLLARSYIQQIESEKNQHRQIEMFATRIQLIMSRVAPVFDVMRDAAKKEPEISVLLQYYLDGRIQGMNYFFECLTANGNLRLDRQTAVETLWTLTSAEVYNLLINNRRWTTQEYERWLAGTLIRLLLS
jgi:AcrR family transcriptional regulator